MKTISQIIIGAICVLNAFTGTAQSEVINNLQSNLVKIEADYLDVKIETWSEKYIQIDSDVKINLSDGKENHMLQVQNSTEGIVVKSILNVDDVEQMIITTDEDGNKTFTPASQWDDKKHKIRFSNMNLGYDIEGELTVHIPENMWLNTKTTYGDVAINGYYQQIESTSTYGMIEAKLDKVSDMRKVNLTSVYDIVDLSLAESSDAKLSLQSTYGSVFSDLPLEPKNGNSITKENCSSRIEKYVLNDGTVDINIVATYDNIYVRSN